MTFETNQFGQKGEVAAVDFLVKQYGYKILEKNFRNQFGEIDIIAQDKETICFIEVKSRQSLSYGSGLEAISSQKKKQLTRVALSYLNLNHKDDIYARFDIVSIQIDSDHQIRFEIIKNAFELVLDQW